MNLKLWAVRLLPHAALQAWFTPPPRSLRRIERDLEILDGFAEILIPFGDDGLTGYTIGDGPLVLAIHGWGGRPAQMAPIARRFAAEGMRVVAIEMPGHAGGASATVKDSAAAVAATVEHLGAPAALAVHSYGSMVARLAFHDEAPAVVVMVAPMVKVTQGIDVFGRRAKLAPWTRIGMRRRLRRWSGELWPMVDRVRPDQLPGADILIVHDPADDDTSFVLAADLAARRPGTTLDPAAGLGHNRILADANVLDRIAGFVTARVALEHG